MPLVDKPLVELQNYSGTNPRPDDFDSYWDEALIEQRATDPNPVFIPYSGIQSKVAECFDLYFTGVGGARLHAKYLRPRTADRPSPALLQFHGYGSYSGEWTDKLALVGEGCAVASLDCRGQGGLSQDLGGVLGTTLNGHIIRGLDDPDPRRLLYRAHYLDTVQLARILMDLPEIDAKRLGAYGSSQGGALTLACAALEPRIKKIAPVFPFLCDFQRVWEMDLGKDAYAELTNYFRRFDPRHERAEEIFRKLGYIDVQFLAPRIRAEVLFYCGLMDTVCPPSTQFAAYNKISSPKKMILYPDFRHENLPEEPLRTFNFFATL